MALWVRARLGGVFTSGNPGTGWLHLFTNLAGQQQTVRRLVAQWNIDLEGNATSAVANSLTPMTLGITYNTRASGSPVPPAYSPSTGVNGFFTWWQGLSYTAAYGNLTEEGGVVGFNANGTIDSKANHEMNSTTNTDWWIGASIEDAAGDWMKFYLIAWTSILVAPTGT